MSSDRFKAVLEPTRTASPLNRLFNALDTGESWMSIRQLSEISGIEISNIPDSIEILKSFRFGNLPVQKRFDGACSQYRCDRVPAKESIRSRVLSKRSRQSQLFKGFLKAM